MKLIIDIPEDVTEDIKKTYEGCDVLYVAVKYGTPIPDNATNGDVIKAMFPKIDDNFSNVIDLKLWWNAPYQKGGKE